MNEVRAGIHPDVATRVFSPAFAARTAVLIRRVLLAGFFFFCLYPLSVGGISVNYSFVFLPLLIALLQGRLKHPGDLLMLVMAFYVLVFFVATTYQVDLFDETRRRLISFALFMSIFSYAFITVDAEKIAAFKIALVAISVYFSIDSARELLATAAIRIVGYEAKDLVGSQRFGFIYLVAVWLVFIDRPVQKFLGFARYPVLAVLITGLLLTFSRSSIVAIIASLVLFAIAKQKAWLTHLSFKGVFSAITTVIGVGVIIYFLFGLFPVVFDFFSVRLFGFFADAEAVRTALSDENSSEGTRMLVATKVLEFLTRNPFTGSGYLGVWSLRSLPVNSAHNQYLDVLFRTGFIGFFLYACLLLGLLRSLWRHHEALFWGIVAVLIYGLFHETFKESQGAFVLAFLIGLMAQTAREQKKARRAARASRAGSRVVAT